MPIFNPGLSIESKTSAVQIFNCENQPRCAPVVAADVANGIKVAHRAALVDAGLLSIFYFAFL